ncbi:MAG: hypothetical protein K0Q92_3571, partial [Steroidobacteraceae bacterium]|nr:hypothetical protein [Steroidobacteraceae bacterium]
MRRAFAAAFAACIGLASLPS